MSQETESTNKSSVETTKTEEEKTDESKPEETKKGQKGGPPKNQSPMKGEKKGDKSKKKGKRKSFRDSHGGGKNRVHTDILGETAMTNALYICHSVQDLLFWRGYQWVQGGKKQKKKGKK